MKPRMRKRAPSLPSSYVIIWDTVSKIPKGRVTTYGEIAGLSGFSGAARLVGYALHNLPNGTDVPWHRVINAAGKISFKKSQDLYDIQRKLLRKEGVVFLGEKVSFMRYGWPRKRDSVTQKKQSKRRQ